MLANAFKRATAGSKCNKCGSVVNFAYIKRHNQECKGIVPTTVIEDNDSDGIEVVDEVIKVVSVETSTPTTRKTNKRQNSAPATIKKPISNDEVVMLSDSEDVVEPLPKKSSTKSFDQPSTSNASGATTTTTTYTKTARALVYVEDPSANMTLPEVYEKLMEQLEKLCSAGSNAGYLIASQTNARLSQSPIKKAPEIEPEVIAEEPQPTSSKATTSTATVEESDGFKPVYPKPQRIPNSGQGFSNIYRPPRHKKDDSAQKAAEKIKPELEADLPETQVLQADKTYGPSYIVRFFWRMLKRVLSKEAGIQGEKAPEFWGDDLRLFYWLVTMSDSEQYLFVRLCLRLRKWLTVDELSKYASNGTSIVDIASGLVAANLIEESDSPNASLTLDEALSRLSRAELNRIARTYKVEHRIKAKDVIFNILAIANGKDVFGRPMLPLVLNNARKHLTNCYRVKEHPLALFNSILTLYCPTHMNTGLLFDPTTTAGLASNLMFQLLQVETHKLDFCGPKDIVKCISIYRNYEELKDYMEAKRIEATMAWDKRSGKYQNMYDNGMIAINVVKNMAENRKDHLERLSLLPHHLRRYTDAWVYVRSAAHTVDAMERLRKYDEAVELIEFLLNTDALLQFCPDRRGFLYDRLALDLGHHLKRKDDSLNACVRGMSDPIVRNKDKLLLQDRALRLDKDFEISLKISEPRHICISGKIIDKYLGEQRINHFYVEKNGEKEIVSVEELALRHFREEQDFWNGMHTEGQIWHTVFGIICYDIIFDHNIDTVWFSPIQDAPADLNTLDFFLKRKDRFEQRLSLLLEESQKEVLKDIMKENFVKNRGRTNAKIDWNVFESFADFEEFLSCIKPEALVMIINRIIEDHRHHRSGFPDLTLWDPATKRLALIEVKGPGDKLSTKQRLWLDFFNKHGVEAFVCRVMGESYKNRQIPNQPATSKKNNRKKIKEEVERQEMEVEDDEIVKIDRVVSDDEFDMEEEEEESDLDFVSSSKPSSSSSMQIKYELRSSSRNKSSPNLIG
uniref:Fanconi-associated nuclease n=1 Tax=Panagrolaimus sp. PS1159 TaxID=55785 RepID=A0AC35FKZ8_9BILA